MKIGIDASTWVNRRGYGRFTRGLVNAMVTGFPQHAYTLVIDDTMANEPTFPPGATLRVVRTSERQTTAASADGSRRAIDVLRMGRAASRLDLDVFLFPTNYSFFPFWSRTPTVTVFHDATAELLPSLIFPNIVPRTLWRIKSLLALRQSAQLVTVSDDARTQIARVFGRAAGDIEVVSEGTDPAFSPLHDALERTRVSAAVRTRFRLPSDTPLLLYVGGISPHKNIDGLLRAIATLDRTRRPCHLVIVGDLSDDNFLTCYDELRLLVAERSLIEHVTFTGFVEDADLVALYQAATMLVLPSMSEGFGLPVLEAMACGLPVAVSNRFSLPEIVGDAGRLFDPTSDDDIASALRQLLGDGALRAAMSARGLVRAEAYSWGRGAQTMMRILERVVTHREAHGQ